MGTKGASAAVIAVPKPTSDSDILCKVSAPRDPRTCLGVECNLKSVATSQPCLREAELSEGRVSSRSESLSLRGSGITSGGEFGSGESEQLALSVVGAVGAAVVGWKMWAPAGGLGQRA
jgi:hypothetical protein